MLILLAHCELEAEPLKAQLERCGVDVMDVTFPEYQDASDLAPRTPPRDDPPEE